MKKTFRVTLRKTTVFEQTVTVEAENEEQASDLGDAEVSANPEWDFYTDFVEVHEVKEETP